MCAGGLGASRKVEKEKVETPKFPGKYREHRIFFFVVVSCPRKGKMGVEISFLERPAKSSSEYS
jgi:hypothetical protein